MEAQHLTDSIALTLLGLGTHAAGLGGLGGMGEITLRDGLVAACAAEGARRRKAWIFSREQTPPGWNDETVDVVVQRVAGGQTRWVTAVELKWWRDSTTTNASNRRAGLVRDIIRCASIHFRPGIEERALVVLVATKSSWDATAASQGQDDEVCRRLRSANTEIWPLRRSLHACPAVKSALKRLVRPAKNASGTRKAQARTLRLPPPSSLRTRRLGVYTSDLGGADELQVRVWECTKVQNSKGLDLVEVDTLTR